MAGDIQAVLNSQTAGVSDIHAWLLMLPCSSRVSPVTYHSVVAVRYPDLCRRINGLWELGTNARINGLVATDLETLVSEVLHPFPNNVGFADGLFVMTTATDHKNNLNRSVLKKDYARTFASSGFFLTSYFVPNCLKTSSSHLFSVSFNLALCL